MNQAMQREVEPPISITYDVQFVSMPTPEPEEEPEPEPEPPPEPEPVPEEKPEPKPEPKPKKEVKKPESKPESKPKPKDPPPAPKPKPPEPEPKAEVTKPKPAKTGIQIQLALPSILNSWGRWVQRKVEKYWTIPGGIDINDEGNEAVISFWVDQDGNLIGRPEIVKHASNKALGESGVRAILLAAPLPPLPVEYDENEQQVVYAFSLAKEK